MENHSRKNISGSRPAGQPMTNNSGPSRKPEKSDPRVRGQPLRHRGSGSVGGALKRNPNANSSGRQPDRNAEAGVRMRKKSKKKSDDESPSRREAAIALILAAIIIILIALFLLKGCTPESLALNQPEYEEDASGREPDDEGNRNYGARVNLAVMDGYEVSASEPDFLVAYPSQNRYDIEISFRDENDMEIYRTKRIRNGTEVSIPGYSFLEKGTTRLDAVISVYDPDTWEFLNEAATMKIRVTKN